MKFKCTDCGATFTEDEMGRYEECVGEFWGVPAYETFGCCPCCKSDEYEEYVEKDSFEITEEMMAWFRTEYGRGIEWEEDAKLFAEHELGSGFENAVFINDYTAVEFEYTD